MAAFGHNPLVAVQIALVVTAADTVEQHYGPTPPDAFYVSGGPGREGWLPLLRIPSPQSVQFEVPTESRALHWP